MSPRRNWNADTRRRKKPKRKGKKQQQVEHDRRPARRGR